MLGGARRHGPFRLPTGPGTPETPHCTPPHTQEHARTHRNTHGNTRTGTCTCAHRNTHTQEHAHTGTHTGTRTQEHSRTGTRTRAHTHTHTPQGRWLENPPRPLSTTGTLGMTIGTTTAPAPTASQRSKSTSGSASLLHGSFVLVPAAARLETHWEASRTEAAAQACPKSSPDGRELTGTLARAHQWASPPSTTTAPAGTGLLHTTTGVTNFWSHVIR